MERTQRRKFQARSRRNKLPAALQQDTSTAQSKKNQRQAANAPFCQSLNVSENEAARENVKLSASHRGPRGIRPSRERGMLKWQHGAEQQDALRPLTDVNYY